MAKRTAIDKRLPAAFFQNESGKMPVREWLLSLADEDRKSVGDDIRTVLFCVHSGTMVLLHGFIKKTKKTPVHDLDIALARQKGLG